MGSKAPWLPTGADAMDIAIDPFVGDSGDSRPVVGSIWELELVSDVDEPDPEESESLGCTQAASSKRRTVVAIPNRMV